MLPDLIICLPRDVPLPQYRLFQRVRFYRDEDEEETAIGLVVGWRYITREQIEDNERAGYSPRWEYAIQFERGYLYGTVGEPQFVDESDILEIVEL